MKNSVIKNKDFLLVRKRFILLYILGTIALILCILLPNLPIDEFLKGRFLDSLQLTLGRRAIQFSIFAAFVIGTMVYFVGLNIAKLFANKIQVTENKLNKSLKDAEGKYRQLIELTMDLNSSKKETERLGLVKDQFISTMSHEIRTPLNAIIGIVNLLELEQNQIVKDERFDILKFGSNNLLSLINDILDYQKIVAGKIALNKEPFDLEELIDKTTQIWEIRGKEKGLEVMLEKSGEIGSSYLGDMTRLGQVLNNLINNAIKFTDEGLVSLKVEVKDDELIYFEVFDTGIGIPEKKQKKVFESFEQVDASHTQKQGGTGLGLAISNKLVELMGGKIELKSKEEFGSKFFFTVPLKKLSEKKVNDSENLNTDKELKKSLNILIVEDNPGNQKIASGFLEHWGHSYDIANNGLEAQNKISKGIFDIVLMDLRMPVMNGFDASRAIREKEGNYFKNLPIIALSASTLSEEKHKIFEFGINDYVSKPFNPRELKDKLMEWAG